LGRRKFFKGGRPGGAGGRPRGGVRGFFSLELLPGFFFSIARFYFFPTGSPRGPKGGDLWGPQGGPSFRVFCPSGLFRPRGTPTPRRGGQGGAPKAGSGGRKETKKKNQEKKALGEPGGGPPHFFATGPFGAPPPAGKKSFGGGLVPPGMIFFQARELFHERPPPPQGFSRVEFQKPHGPVFSGRALFSLGLAPDTVFWRGPGGFFFFGCFPDTIAFLRCLCVAGLPPQGGFVFFYFFFSLCCFCQGPSGGPGGQKRGLPRFATRGGLGPFRRPASYPSGTPKGAGPGGQRGAPLLGRGSCCREAGGLVPILNPGRGGNFPQGKKRGPPQGGLPWRGKKKPAVFWNQGRYIRFGGAFPPGAPGHGVCGLAALGVAPPLGRGGPKGAGQGHPGKKTGPFSRVSETGGLPGRFPSFRQPAKAKGCFRGGGAPTTGGGSGGRAFRGPPVAQQRIILRIPRPIWAPPCARGAWGGAPKILGASHPGGPRFRAFLPTPRGGPRGTRRNWGGMGGAPRTPTFPRFGRFHRGGGGGAPVGRKGKMVFFFVFVFGFCGPFHQLSSPCFIPGRVPPGRVFSIFFCRGMLGGGRPIPPHRGGLGGGGGPPHGGPLGFDPSPQGFLRGLSSRGGGPRRGQNGGPSRGAWGGGPLNCFFRLKDPAPTAPGAGATGRARLGFCLFWGPSGGFLWLGKN